MGCTVRITLTRAFGAESMSPKASKHNDHHSSGLPRTRTRANSILHPIIGSSRGGRGFSSGPRGFSDGPFSASNLRIHLTFSVLKTNGAVSGGPFHLHQISMRSVG